MIDDRCRRELALILHPRQFAHLREDLLAEERRNPTIRVVPPPLFEKPTGNRAQRRQRRAA